MFQYVLIFFSLFFLFARESLRADPPSWNNIFTETQNSISHVDLTFRPNNETTNFEVDILSSLWNDGQNFLLCDIRGLRNNEEAAEGNIGLAYRKIMENEFLTYNSVFGIYCFYDRRKTKHSNTFGQFVFGTELLFENFDIHYNLYSPTTKNLKTINPTQKFSLEDGAFLQASEQSVPGFDLTLRHRMPIKFMGSDHIWFSAGFYCFGEDGSKKARGYKWTLDVAFSDLPFLPKSCRLDLGSVYQKDDIRGDIVSAYTRISFPFGSGVSSGENGLFSQKAYNRIGRRIVRDPDIICIPKDRKTPATLVSAPITLSGGTVFVKTNQELHDATTHGKENSLIVVQKNIKVSHPVILKKGQALISGGETMSFSMPNKTKTVEVSLPGEAGKISNVSLKKKPPIVAQQKNNNFVKGVTDCPIPTFFFEKILVDSRVTDGQKLDQLKITPTSQETYTYKLLHDLRNETDQKDEGIFMKSDGFYIVNDTDPNAPTDVKILDFDTSTGEFTRTADPIKGEDEDIFRSAEFSVEIQKGSDAANAVRTTGMMILSNKNFANVNAKSPFTKVRKYEGVPMIVGTDGVTESNMDHALEVLKDFLKKDRENPKKPITSALLKSGAQIVLYKDEEERDSDFSKIFSEKPSQDLQSDEMHRRASVIDHPIVVDRSLEEILHFIHDHGIDMSRPDFQEDLQIALQDALQGPSAIYSPPEDVKGTFSESNEYLAMAVLSYYGAFKGNNGPTLSESEYDILSAEKMKTQDKKIYDLIEEYFPDKLDHLQ